MEKWTELRTAYVVARTGTVSAAAQSLGVHRATVNRHIDVLEATLGVKLFLRHARGYVLTDAGQEMLEITQRANEMFADLAGRSHNRQSELTGELIITSLPVVAPLVMPAIAAYQAENPAISVLYSAGRDLKRLEYGEAHVALRAGQKPVHEDYIVSPFGHIRFGLYAHESYINQHGFPENVAALSSHRLIGPEDKSDRMPFRVLEQLRLPESAFVLRTSDLQVTADAIHAGFGIGLLMEHDAVKSPELRAIGIPAQAWSVTLWVVTHIDLHRSAKVQRFLSALRSVCA